MKAAQFGCATLLAVVFLCTVDQRVWAEEMAPKKLLRHVVLFTFQDDATPEQVDEIVKAFGELPKKIKQIHAYEWGQNNSPEGLNKTHTHCFLVTFKSEADRDAYLPHPAHKEFVAKLKPILKDVTVVDYWAAN